MIREEIVSGLLQPMRLLAIPIPPPLDIALGYDRPPELAARFVAFYWKESGDELLWDDGRNTSTANWVSWQSFVEHPVIAPHFLALHRRGVSFGGTGARASHYFLLDRQRRCAYAGCLLDVVRLLALQQSDNKFGQRSGIRPNEEPGIAPDSKNTTAQALRRKTLSQLLGMLANRVTDASPALTVQQEKFLPEVRELESRLRTQRNHETEMVLWLDDYQRQVKSSEQLSEEQAPEILEEEP